MYTIANAYESALEEAEFVFAQLYKQDYNSYEYSTEYNGYIYEDPYGILSIIKFKDGKLKTISMEASNEEEIEEHSATQKATYQASYVFTLDGQRVTLPEVKEDESAAKNVVGEEVTQETWDAAFDGARFGEIYANFKLEESIISTQDMDGKMNIITQEATYTYVKGLSYVKRTTQSNFFGNFEEEYYVDETSGSASYIAKIDGLWESVINEGAYVSATDYLMQIVKMLPSLDYEDYEYSAEYKGYAYKDADEGELYVLKFQNGKLKAIYGEPNYAASGVEYTTIFSYVMTYGGQSVTPPKV